MSETVGKNPDRALSRCRSFMEMLVMVDGSKKLAAQLARAFKDLDDCMMEGRVPTAWQQRPTSHPAD